MTQGHSPLFYPADPLECITLDDALIVYSERRNGYFGIRGVATDILALSRQWRGGLSQEDIVARIAGDTSPNAADVERILHGISSLLDLGVLHEG